MERRSDTVTLIIKITDTGIGMEPGKKEKIFQRFFQNELPKAIVNQGSGIGLSITQEFIKMQNGRISVESELNRGSCFTITLPFREILVPAIVSEMTDSAPRPLKDAIRRRATRSRRTL